MPFLPTELFKDSAQAANRCIYNHSVDSPACTLLQMMLFWEAISMVTINPLALQRVCPLQALSHYPLPFRVMV